MQGSWLDDVWHGQGEVKAADGSSYAGNSDQFELHLIRCFQETFSTEQGMGSAVGLGLYMTATKATVAALSLSSSCFHPHNLNLNVLL